MPAYHPLTSKTVWAGLGMIVVGSARCYFGDYLGGGQTILTGLGAIFMRNAVAANGLGK